MGGFAGDVLYAVRTMRRNPAAAAVAILTLAIGIGGTTAVFSVIDPLVLRQMPVPNANDLISVEVVRPDVRQFVPFTPEGLRVAPNVSPAEFALLRARTQVLADAFLEAVPNEYEVSRATPAGEPRPVVRLDRVSAGFFSTLHVVPALGRAFIEDDTRRDAQPVAVIGNAMWRRLFGADAGVIGRELTLTRRDLRITMTIVGVAPPGFTGTDVGLSSDVWTLMPAERQPAASPRALPWWSGGRMMARLGPGVDVDDARRELASAHADLLRQQAGQFDLTPEQRKAFIEQPLIVRSGSRGWGDLRAQYAEPLFIVFAALGAVLAIACANVAMLLLAQGMSRARELAICLAVGSGRWRLVRQQLTTSAVLAAGGGVAGFLMAAWAVRGLVGYVPPLADSALDFTPSIRAAIFTFGVSMLSAVVFGILPALRLTRLHPNLTLKSTGPVAISSRWTTNRSLVAVQIAVSLILLVVAGLLMRSLYNLRGIDTGFDPAVLRVSVRGEADYERVLAQLERVPGVESATAWQGGLFGEGVSVSGPVIVDGFTAATEQERFVPSARVGPRFFEAMGIAILHGRAFRPEDSLPNRNVIIVSEAMALHFFGQRDAVGRRFRLSPGPRANVFEIVGVAENTKYNSLRESAPRTIYSPLDRNPANVGLAVRIRTDRAPTPAAIADAIRQLDPTIQVTGIRSLSEILEIEILRERMLARAALLLSGLGLFLACLGLYGTMSYAIARRTAEIGIRMALGARAGTVVQMLMRESGAIVAAGAALGLGAAFLATRALAGLLFGLTVTDPQTIGAAVLFLVAAATLAGYLAARRAARIDPIIALRYE